MGVIKDHVWVLSWVGYDPDALEAVAFVLAPVDGGRQIAVAEHAPAKKWQGNLLAEEDMADAGGDVGEGVADTADDKVLERGGSLDEGWASGSGEQVAFIEK